MKAAFGFVSSVPGVVLAAKIVAAVVALAAAAGGALVAFSQKSYAPETIQFDGRTFYLVTERNGATGDIITVGEKRGAAFYAAGYADSPEHPKETNIVYYMVFYDANPAPELTREDGAYSAVAHVERERRDIINSDDPRYLRQTRKPDGDSIYLLSAFGQLDGAKMRADGRRCGASRPGAYACVISVNRIDGGEYASAEEWMAAEGESHINRVYDALAEYPLTHNEELLADMAAAVK